MSDSRFTLDTNILFYAADPDASEKHLRALAVTDSARELDCVLTLQALGELFHAMRKRRKSAEVAAQTVRAYERSFPIISATAADLDDALHAHQQHNLPFWDAMLWVTARRAGCSLILTEDLQDGRTLGGVLFRNPFHLSRRDLKTLLA